MSRHPTLKSALCISTCKTMIRSVYYVKSCSVPFGKWMLQKIYPERAKLDQSPHKYIGQCINWPNWLIALVNRSVGIFYFTLFCFVLIFVSTNQSTVKLTWLTKLRHVSLTSQYPNRPSLSFKKNQRILNFFWLVDLSFQANRLPSMVDLNVQVDWALKFLFTNFPVRQPSGMSADPSHPLKLDATGMKKEAIQSDWTTLSKTSPLNQ